MRHRRAFGASLVDQPLMRNVLADLAVEAEAATTVALWLADVTDRAIAGVDDAAPLRRNAAPFMRRRRWNAWAATAMTRSRGCRGCIGRRR